MKGAAAVCKLQAAPVVEGGGGCKLEAAPAAVKAGDGCKLEAALATAKGGGCLQPGSSSGTGAPACPRTWLHLAHSLKGKCPVLHPPRPAATTTRSSWRCSSRPRRSARRLRPRRPPFKPRGLQASGRALQPACDSVARRRSAFPSRRSASSCAPCVLPTPNKPQTNEPLRGAAARCDGTLYHARQPAPKGCRSGSPYPA